MPITISPEKAQALRDKYNVGGTSTSTGGSLESRLQAARDKAVEGKKWEDKGVFGNLKQDVTETFTDMGKDLKARGSKFKESYKANMARTQSPIETGVQYAGNTIGGAFDVLGNVVKGAVKTVLPEVAEKGLKKSVDYVANTAPVRGLAEKYGTLSDRTKRNVGAVGNILSVVPVGKTVKAVGEIVTGKALAKGAVKETVKGGVKAGVKKTVEKTVKATKAGTGLTKDVTKSAISKVTGLEPDDISTIFRNPEKFTKANMVATNRDDFAKGVYDQVKGKIDDLSETGKGYAPLRESAGTVNIPRRGLGSILNKEFGIEFKKGVVKVTKESKATLNEAEVTKLQKFLDKYADVDNLSRNAALNARKELDRLAKWDTGAKSTELDRVAKGMRKYYDTKAKTQIPGLKELDAKFAVQKTDLNKIMDEIIESSGPYAGQLKKNAISKLANLTGKGKERLLVEMEKMRPGITGEVKILKAIQGFETAKGNKVGTYGSAAANTLGTVGIATGQPWLMAAFLAHPPIALNLIRGAGMVNKFGKGIIERITGKIKKGADLGPAEMGIVKEAFDVEKPSRKTRELIKTKAPEVYKKYFSDETVGKATDDAYVRPEDMPVIEMGKPLKRKKSSLPVAEDAPNVFSPLMRKPAKK